MYHHPFEKDAIERRRKAAAPKRRRTIGLREILLVIIAFTLLALLPTTAQFGRSAPIEVKEGLSAMERPEENFAGSAFYFLDPADTAATMAQSSETLVGDRLASLQVGDTAIADAALPFTLKPGTANYSRALKCLTDAIYYEAANEPDDGQRAVAQVIINATRLTQTAFAA
jgi:hypothetical protein